MKFLFFLLCFLVARFAGANPPSFLMPEYVNPWRDQYDSLTQAFEDALILARTVATTFDATKTCDIFLNRYFHQDEARFVSDVFRTIANIPLDIPMAESSAPLNPDLSNILVGLTTPARFELMLISWNDNPIRMVLPNTPSCDDGATEGWYEQCRLNADGACISMCDLVWDHPPLQEIFQPEIEWIGHPGFGCETLLGEDTNLMLPAGGVLLREMLKWNYLFSDNVREWDIRIRTNAIHEHQINEYQAPGPNSIPPNGRGPYNAALLKTLPRGALSETVNNAENYVWFALSRYWSIKCGAVFGPATDPSASFLRDSAYNRYLVRPPA